MFQFFHESCLIAISNIRGCNSKAVTKYKGYNYIKYKGSNQILIMLVTPMAKLPRVKKGPKIASPEARTLKPTRGAFPLLLGCNLGLSILV